VVPKIRNFRWSQWWRQISATTKINLLRLTGITLSRDRLRRRPPSTRDKPARKHPAVLLGL